MDYDVSITSHNKSGALAVLLPIGISRSMRERGYTRARLELTDQGILVRPYQGKRPPRGTSESVQLPDWPT